MLPFLTRCPVCRTACIEVLCVTVLQYKGLVDAEEPLFYMIDVLGACGECLNCQLRSNKTKKTRRDRTHRWWLFFRYGRAKTPSSDLTPSKPPQGTKTPHRKRKARVRLLIRAASAGTQQRRLQQCFVCRNLWNRHEFRRSGAAACISCMQEDSRQYFCSQCRRYFPRKRSARLFLGSGCGSSSQQILGGWSPWKPTAARSGANSSFSNPTKKLPRNWCEEK